MIKIIPATPDDFGTIRDLAYAIWPVTYGEILSKEQLDYMLGNFYSVETLQNNVAQKNHRFEIVEEDGKALGFLSYEHNYQNQPVTRIHKIYVLPQTQGRGIGKLLMDRAAEVARENRSNTLSLNVNRFNKALGFYQKIGFAITAEEDIDIGRGYLMEDYIMEKAL
ncbi:GNAT family N-acetyltransferase [Flavobacterium sp.]|uniref:GNAT family N-acetyltransferase n=1 Tax=Flavobacterium sp. TaxID=239 RepID=UPI0039E631DC